MARTKKIKNEAAAAGKELSPPTPPLRRSRRISRAQPKDADLAEVGQVGLLSPPTDDEGDDKRTIKRPRKKRRPTIKPEFEGEAAPLPSPSDVQVPEASQFPILALQLHGLPSDRVSFYGLVQEVITPDVFGMLIVTILLNQTTGRAAIPVFYDVLERWPTPMVLAEADVGELTGMLQPIGLHNIRAKRLIDLAKTWCETPPQLGVLHKSRVVLPSPSGRRKRRKKSNQANGNDADEPPARPIYPATEISHLPGAGRYALDSYRLFRPSLIDATRAAVQIGLGPKPESERWQRILNKREELGESRDVGRLLPASSEEDATGKHDFIELEEDWKMVDALDKELKAYRLWRNKRQHEIEGQVATSTPTKS